MVRETRHLWVGNLPDNIREDRIREHFKRYGRVQSVKLLSRGGAKEETSESAMACTVAFMDIKSASKAHTAEHKLDDRTLTTEYYEPAAIPSSASPQNTSSTYSTSPGANRFPNGHGSTEEHAAFNERFYDRTTPRVTEGEFVRRPGYHENARGRNRDRSYRNGPYNNIPVDRTHRPVTAWPYDSTRYNNQTSNETGYTSAPTETTERRTSDGQAKKKTKSRSGSRSASAGSTSSRSQSRSRSRSSSSSSSSSTSRATSSSGSPKSRRLASSGNASHQPVVHSEDQRPLAICVRNLPLRSSDTSLKDGLFHEYKKHGKVTWVKVVGQSSERHAIVCFKKPEDVEKALEVSYDKMFFGSKIEVAPYQGYDVEDNDLRPYEAEIDEFHPKATRTLFIGNLEKDVTASDLRKHFDQFGEIIEIDIKKQGAVSSSYAFCQYSDIVSVVKAIRNMDGEHLGNNRVKLGFGKSMPTNCVWVDGVTESVNEKYLMMQFDPFGPVTQVIIDRDKGQALIFYEQVVNAQTSVNKMRGSSLRGRKMQVDYASRECQEAFREHLEKQGLVMDRTVFEERRDSASRSFETATFSAIGRFSRYDTPTRPRTSSYSSRSSAAASQCNATTIPSPGTPGSGTPRGSGSRSRIARFADYYDQTGVEYTDRHFRSYDEYSQGSAASHEDPYEHDYIYSHESPSHIDSFECRVLVNKDRLHVLDQLEDCHSSGDEIVSPKKRLKLVDILDSTNDVIIEANRDHRKVMEVRRLSDVSIKHHSRRPSVDSKHSRDVGHERGAYLPHAICKRRKTAGSDSGSRLHHYDHSGSESVGGSRPGTPLCDERPEHFTPSEPRRVPREREGPLTLPLPKFAAHVMNRGSVSVAGIKGQKDCILSSPPPTVTSPRISNPKPPSPTQVPPPASPPPRPPSLSSNSSDSDVASSSPSLDERIKSLDEKYEKWSGSRALSAAGNDALAKLDANRDRFRFRHKLLDLDLKELQPSEIVKSVMAKRSVFDEDSKRLENVGEKYEPRDFGAFPRNPPAVQAAVPSSPLPAPQPIKVTSVAMQLPKTPTMLSPRSTGAAVTAAKGLQYPFPSHPPAPPPPATGLPAAPPPLLQPAPTSSTTIRSSSHGENRLKPCPPAPSDNRTPSKVSVNRTVTNSAVVSNLTQTKTSDNSKCGAIPTSSSEPTVNASALPDSNPKGVCARDVKTGDKVSEKVTSRRDSSSNCVSPKNRRNSEEDNLRNEEAKKEQQRLEKIRIENEKLEKERLEKERQERERLEKEKLDMERLEKERQEKERIERERLEKERLAKIERENKEREEREKREKEEQERRERKEREERERREREQREMEEKERREREEKERERREQEERERQEAEKRNEEMEREKEKDRARKEEERKHKDDNHDKRKEDHSRYHSEYKHRENNVDKHTHESKNTKDSSRDDKSKENVENKLEQGHEKARESDKIKDSVKENNLHDRSKNCVGDYRERHTIETRHTSIDLDKSRPFEHNNKLESSRRKERNNSLPGNIGSKRRISSQDENPEESKRLKLSQEYKKLSDRRDSKDSRTDEKSRLKHKNGSSKSHDDKPRLEKHNSIKDSSDEKRKDRDKDEKHKSKQKLDKQKSKKSSRDKDASQSPTTPISPPKEITDKDFLARLDLRATDEIERQKQRREAREKQRKQESFDGEERKDKDDKRYEERRKEKCLNSEKKHRDEVSKSQEDRRKKDRLRKMTQNSSDNNTDSDEPKKHSIFDIVDDEPAYISMYDKVKARSCKNMQKHEEEKRQEKIKAKFSQLKQSRAKREEKKRSTSWDEDSDSDRDKSDLKMRRANKMLIASSDDEDFDHMKKKRDSHGESDYEKNRRVKQELNYTSEEDGMKTKTFHRKESKSRITSDTSDDEFKKIKSHVKREMFSDNEVDQGFADSEEKVSKKAKEEYFNNYFKKEAKTSKTHETLEQLNAQIFGESNSPIPELKQEKFINISFGENSSADESVEIKKEKSEQRKKHKKKQKRQKTPVEGEDMDKQDSAVDSLQSDSTEKARHFERKKQHSKKEKKKDKNRDEEKIRDKPKKTKKSKSDSKSDRKMENIFGYLSDDSENGVKEEINDSSTNQNLFERFDEENIHIPASAYASDTDSVSHDKESYKNEEKERISKEEHRRNKEKRKKKKLERLQVQISNENSMDYADMGKMLEDNIKDDPPEEMKIKTEEKVSESTTESVFTFQGVSDHISKEERKELREKKKKRKKNKEEKQSRHHHHHHHDKNKLKSPEIKVEPKYPVEEKPKLEVEVKDQSLPNILEMCSPVQNKSTDYFVSPVRSQEPMVSPISKSSTKEKKREKLIPGFGTEIDEKIHENAVKSISEFEITTPEPAVKVEEEVKVEKPTETTDEKPRVVISQEETEDAVAALLGESFGGSQFTECYEEELNQSGEQVSSVTEENIQQDDEEMRQAVQSLNTGDMDIKPDTPQSENDLQIDTDTEEQEETTPVRLFDQSPRTPDTDLSQPPKTPDVSSSYYRDPSKDIRVVKALPTIGPPSLTPIKQPISDAVKRNLNVALKISTSTAPEPQRTVICSKEDIQKIVDKIESIPAPSLTVVTAQPQTIVAHVQTTVASAIRSYGTPSVVKMSESYPPLSAIPRSNPDSSTSPKIQQNPPASIVKISTPPPLMHNLPARSPYPLPQQKPVVSSQESSNTFSPRIPTTSAPYNRLPITPVMISKPLQSTTVILPQSKAAQFDLPKLVSSTEVRQQDHPPRVSFPGYTQQMVRQTAPPGLLVPAGKLYGYMPSVVPPMYNLTSASKESVPSPKVHVSTVPVAEVPKLLPTSVPTSYSSHPVSQGVTVLAQNPNLQNHIPVSTEVSTSTTTTKPFMNVIQEVPKVVPTYSSSSEVKLSPPVLIQTVLSKPLQSPQPSKEIATEEVSSKDVPPIETPTAASIVVNKEQSESVSKTEEVKKTEDVVAVKEESKDFPKKENVEDEKPLMQSTGTDEVKVEEKEEKAIDNKSIQENEIHTSKEMEKFDEEKADTESTISDLSKERSSAEILNKDDPLDSKEDSDYWSAKEVNIDSVIKTLCSADELSDRSSEVGKDEWLDDHKLEVDIQNQSGATSEEKSETTLDTSKFEDEHPDEGVENLDDKDVAVRGGRRGGRGRGRKSKGVDRTGVQTRRGKTIKEPMPSKRGGRGGKQKSERKISRSESEMSADVYEFRDDSDENNTNKDRPRLILTIKPPVVTSSGNTQQTAVIKEVVKETSGEPKTPENKDEFVSPASNTRKSRRLQERDVSRNTVDDTIEDVVRNTNVVTRAAAAQGQGGTPRRSARQTATKNNAETPRKSPRGGRKKDRRASETTDDSSEEKSVKPEIEISAETVKEPEKPKETVEEEKQETVVKEKPHEGLKAAVLRRVKGEASQEPMTLIDPVTGLLTPVREAEEGRYIPVPGAPNKPVALLTPQVQRKPAETQQQSVITTPQNAAKPQQKPQSLKAHVLSSQAAKAVVSEQTRQVCTPPQLVMSKPVVPISQNLNVNVSMASYVHAHLSPRPNVPVGMSKQLLTTQGPMKKNQLPPLSPNQMAVLTNQQILQQVGKQMPTVVPKAHLVSSQPQVINTQVAHVKHPQMQQQIVINKNAVMKPHGSQQILAGAVASPPPLKTHSPHISASTQSRIVAHQAKTSMEPPKVEVSMGNCVMTPRPNLSPQGQSRHVLQAGMPVPAYEASLHGERNVYNRSRSPPPAHQNSPSPQGETIPHFPPGSVQLRPPHDLPPAHYMHHPQHVMYQQFLRQSYHLPRSVPGGLEKPGDGQEGEEAPVTSPPLELRRPGSVGMALGRSGTVPHGLQSPHERPDSQVNQMYNVHGSRLQPYHSGRFYEQAEPPPAHRPLTSHASLAALGSDRPLGHIGTPDRPLSSHSALASHIGGLGTPDRTITTHIPPERPLSSHGLALGAGLGAAGNLLGAVARHVGADAPASQRGLQAATPPHASQVPPQAESLFMLLKQYPCMWQGLLALKNDQAAVQMYFVSGNETIAKCSLPKNMDGTTPPLRIFQRMRLEQPQVEGVARKMQMENEHCMLLALPCGRDHMDVLKQSTNLTCGFITYLQQKHAAGIINVAAPGTTQPPAYVVHIFPSCDFVNENLRRIAPSLLERVADIAHLLIVITTV